jgi:hypothetical protein
MAKGNNPYLGAETGMYDANKVQGYLAICKGRTIGPNSWNHHHLG